MPSDSLIEHLDFVDMVEEAKLMGYGTPRCANCRHAALVKGLPDHGLCKRQPQGANHLAPIRAFEICGQWYPRYGVLKDSPLMLNRRAEQRKLPQYRKQLRQALLDDSSTTSRTGNLEGW